MNEQEQAIAKIQQTLDYCIQQTLRSLEDTIERKAEVLLVNEVAGVERSEYTHALDELAAIYSKFPAVRSIKNYLHLPNYLWESLNYYFPEATFVWTNSTNNTLLL